MTTKPRAGGFLTLVLVALAAGAVLLAGCSEAGKETIPTSVKVGDSVTETSTTTTKVRSDSQRVVVGGKSVEEYEAALPDLEKAVENAPNDLGALQELAIAQYNTGRYEEAAATYQKMLAIKDDAFTRNNYGNVLRDWKRPEEAKAQYEKAISLDPLQTNAYINLAGVFVSEGHVDDAVKVLDRGLAVLTGDDKTRLEKYKEQLSASTSTT